MNLIHGAHFLCIYTRESETSGFEFCANLIYDMYLHSQITQRGGPKQGKAGGLIRLAYKKLTLEQICPQLQ